MENLTGADLTKKIRKVLGHKGIRELGKTFNSFDSDANHEINSQEFFDGLSKLGCDLSYSESKLILSHYDTSRNSTIDYNEFIKGVYGQMSPMKKNKVQNVFNKLDKTGKGKISTLDLKIAFNASSHPMVIQKLQTSDEAFVAFLSNFADNSNDGTITE